ncbi:MAG: adenosylcobinamide-phosphate synthase CbiB [Albidovulum sp.]|nr:adenosylcobinamide-phosphate synthase CbiB [Albidovulum sp.]MDE0306152.1 adenosylcobinamide-phosphate synthase CbiB [Albidovulum sp.]
MNAAALLLISLVIDAVFGEPKKLWESARHPVSLMGWVVERVEIRLNQGGRKKLKGVCALAIFCAISVVVGAAISAIPDYGILEVLCVAAFLAQKSLADHVGRVAEALRNGVAAGRIEVGHIVGRDTAELDPSGVSRAAIESSAENFSDGVVAPSIWYLVFGLPGLILYKFVNTADSMIGYKSENFREFGWACARADDWLNYIPCRVSGVIFSVAGGSMRAVRIMTRDARLHRSPSAGFPEAAAAAVLGAALAGPRSYRGEFVNEPYIFAEGRKSLDADDIDAAVRLLWRAWWVLTALVLGVAFAY